MSIEKTKVWGFVGQEPLRTKIVINCTTSDKVIEFNYLGYQLSLSKSTDVNSKLHKSQRLQTTILQILVKKEKITKFYKTINVTDGYSTEWF